MVIAVLKSLRPARKQAAVIVYVIYKRLRLSVFIFEGAGLIGGKLSVYLSVEADTPILLRFRRGDRVYPAEKTPRIYAVCILLCSRVVWHYRLRIFAVYPCLYGINAFIACAEFKRGAHGHAKLSHAVHKLIFLHFLIIFFNWRYTQQKSVALLIG